MKTKKIYISPYFKMREESKEKLIFIIKVQQKTLRVKFLVDHLVNERLFRPLTLCSHLIDCSRRNVAVAIAGRVS